MYIASILWVTKNPPKIFIAAKDIARKPKILELLKIPSEFPANPAIIAALAGSSENVFSTSSTFGLIAIILAAVNIFGGFLVTQRMLQMYKKKKGKK